MFPSAGNELQIKPGGILIAVVAFVLTRTLLIGVVYSDSAPSTVAEILRLTPLIVGLGMVLYGVNLAVSTHDRSYARTVALWFLVGCFGIFAMVGLGAVESSDLLATVSSKTLTANAVLGGGAGGILFGTRYARDQRRQELLARQSDRVVLLHRRLRHEILNASTAIRGHAELLHERQPTDDSFDAIRDGIERIERTIDQVGFLIRPIDETGGTLTAVHLDDVVRKSSARLPDSGTVTTESLPPVQVRANEHLETVITELLSGALEQASEPEVSVAVVPDETTVDVSVSAPGQWLSEPARDVLLDGLPEHDNPHIDYEIPTIRLLVAQYGGTIDVIEDETSTSVVVTLLRTTEQAPESDQPGVSGESLRYAALAGLVAGVAMGLILQFVAGEMGIIGSLYGIQTVAVGWVAHLFHSVVFATVFVAALTIDAVEHDAGSLGFSVAFGVLYGAFLWLVAGGLIMGVWLNLVGIPASVPNLGIGSLIGHTVWGALLGTLVFVLPIDDE